MKLSIIIPAYNVEKYIDECLQSVISYISENLEIIVINDGSTDNTANILKKYPFIRLYNNSNKGVSATRNFGIEKATGEYIMFLDSDDCLKENWIDVFNNVHNEDLIYINSTLEVTTDKYNLLNYIIGSKKPCIAGPVSKLYRTQFLKNNKIIFKEDLINGEDMLFNIECLKYANSFSIINESIYNYRQTLTSATKHFDSRIFDSDKNFHLYLNKILEDLSISEKSKENIKNYCGKNAIITILDRLSYLNDFNIFIGHLSFLKDNLYKNFLKAKNNSLSFKSKILLFLINIRQYRLSFVLLRIRQSNKKITKEDYFIEV